MKDKYDKTNLPDNHSSTNARNSALLAIANELALQNKLKEIELWHLAIKDNVEETRIALQSFSTVSDK